MVVRPLTGADAEACLAIVQALPDHFSVDVPAKVGTDLRRHGGHVADDGDQVVGFAVVRRAGAAAEIVWAAVRPDRRGTGIGTALVEAVLDRLGADGVRVVEVKTLDPSSAYEPYRATRAFWEARGFVHLDSVDPFPGWRPGNPAGIYAAALGPTVAAAPDAVDRHGELSRLRAEVARLRSEKAALLRRAAERDYERPPHYQ